MMREKLEELRKIADFIGDEATPDAVTIEAERRLRALIRAADFEDLESDAQTLRGYIKTHGETPAMTWSSREHWKKRAESSEADIEKLKMDAEHLQYERDEAREEGKPLEKSEGQKATEWSQRPTREWEPPASAGTEGPGLRSVLTEVDETLTEMGWHTDRGLLMRVRAALAAPAANTEGLREAKIDVLLEVNLKAEARILKGEQITGAHHRAIEDVLAALRQSAKEGA